MIKLLIVYLFIYCVSVYSQPQWVRINSPTDNLLRKIIFTDSLNGWACGLNGTIIHTADGGENWFLQNTNTSNPIVDIYFLNHLIGWALSWEYNTPPFGTYLLKTTDGGFTWATEFLEPEYEFFRTVFFLNEQFGLIGERLTYYTTDGGFNWNISQRDSDMFANLPFYQIKMFNDSLGFASGGVLDNAGIIWKTSDSGRNWKTNAISPDEIFDFFIFDSLNILALSGDPEYRFGVGLIKSTDGGEFWSYEELPITAICFGIDFRDDLEGWSAAGFKFLYTTDGGITWSEIETPDSLEVYDVVFINNNTGFACGRNGVLLKYIPCPDVVNGNNNLTLTEYKLFQNYPNPFNPTTKLSFIISHPSLVTLSVYDILGNVVAKLVDEYREAGRYEITFDATNLQSGIYFYTLKAGSFIETKKMILIK